MSLVKVTVDNNTYEVEKDSLLIDLLIKENLRVPYFCYHEALGADGNCRMCMVEIEGQKRPQIACDTPVKDGMVVYSQGKKLPIKKIRRDILELELINHPVDCPICDQAGECSLQEYYMEYGLHDSHMYGLDKVTHHKHIDLGSNVMLDQERCVLCARCTRFTANITHTHELGIVGRGDEAHITTMPGRKLDNPYAMNVVDLCPVGALTSKDFRFAQRVWFLESSESVCTHCAKNCNIYIDHNKLKYQDENIYRFRPRKNLEVNGFFICNEGRLSYKNLLNNRMIKSTHVNEKDILKNSIEKAKAIAVLVDASLFNEEIEMIKEFSEKIGAKLYCPQDTYIDEEFEDDMLRSKYKIANIKTIQNLNILDEMPKDADLVINFNHPDITKIDSKEIISFQTHKFELETILTIPIATYVENSGSFTNIDGITQHLKKAITLNEPIPTIAQWFKRLEL
ncbi:2Fe-2S iron-sulfur cluster-binding protein [Sulfurimonas sp.]|uniref:2Fe-2S iron-sulfur cluster-binding protein n=1 Tax=Sulfurimonas sp. TaxID=2022749 RepID=UPI00356A2316